MWLRFQSHTRPSPVTTATGHASPASALSATSVPAGDVDDPLLNLRSRSHAMRGVIIILIMMMIINDDVKSNNDNINNNNNKTNSNSNNNVCTDGHVARNTE